MLTPRSDTEGTDDDTPVPRSACTAIYDTMDQMLASTNNIPPECIDKYLARIQVKILDDSLHKYDTTVANGYDGKFQIYAKHIKELVPLQLKAYMAGAQASGFFTCTTTHRVTCCKSCQSAWGCPPDCDGSKDCVSGVRTTTIKCPTEIPDPSNQQSNVQAIDYKCSDANGFYADIAKKYGIDSSWIIFGKFLARINGGCWGSTDIHCGDDTNTYWTGFPLPGTINVNDPKSLISVDKTKALSAQLSSKVHYMDYGLDGLQNSDVVDAASVPALLAASAVDSMGKVVDTANQISAAERKAAILDFVMAILLLIPGVGEVADGAGLVALRGIINLLGDVGNIALGIFDLVQDPKNAVFALFGLLLGAPGTAKTFIDAANTRRGFTGTELDTLAPIKADLDKITTLRSSCFK